MAQAAIRRSRWSISDQPYFVTMVARERKPLFIEFGTARLIVEEMRGTHALGLVDSLAWVLMPDRLHWLFILRDRADLGSVMKDFRSRSTASIARSERASRSIWHPGYCGHAIRPGEQLQSIGRYIIGNPVRARLVDKLGDYPHWDAVWL